MASREKKDASEALSRLKSILKRDPGSIQLIDSISRYMVSLRHANSQLKKSEERTREYMSASVETVMESADDLIQVRKERDRAIGECRKLELDRSKLSKRVRELEAQLDPDIDEGKVESSHLPDLRGFVSMFKDLRGRMNVPPAPTAKGRPMYVFELEDIVSGYNYRECETLGMFATVCAVLGFPVCLIMRDKISREDLTALRKGRETSETEKFAVWIYETWLRKNPEWQDKLMMRACGRPPTGADITDSEAGMSVYFK